MQQQIRQCKNGCNKPTHRSRAYCKECVNEQNRIRWQLNKKYYRKNYLKDKHTATCKYCNKEFDTARDNQVFCSENHKYKWHYENRTDYDKSRAKAILKIHDKDKKVIGGKFYTDKEIKFIKKNIDKLSGVEIAKKLDRPVNGVRNKMRKLRDE